MRKLSLSLLFLAASTAASANTVTLTAAASVQGQALFKSDVRVFNRNQTTTISVTATYYYCSGGSCGQEKSVNFTVPSRNSASFNDIVSTLFALPNTQGAIEFGTAGDDLVVTSRLYSENAGGSFGQFVPGLEDSDAFPFSVLTSLQENADFRTNFVAFNLNDSDSVSATVTLHDGTGAALGSANLALGPHTFFPSTRLTTLVGVPSATFDNGYVVIDTAGAKPLFVAASVLDNHSQDTIFIKGESDSPPPAGQAPVASFTVSGNPTAGVPVQFTDTSTGNPTSWSWDFGDGSAIDHSQNPSHTFAQSGNFNVILTAANSVGSGAHTSAVAVQPGTPQPTNVVVHLARFAYTPGTATPITLHVGTSYTLTLTADDNGQGQGHGFFGVSALGIPRHDNILPGSPFTTPVFTPTQVGQFTFSCSTVCGGGHSGMAGTIMVVQ
jgi:PKD domain